VHERADGMLVVPTPLFARQRDQLAARAADGPAVR
jgi:hypothetical protein